MASTSAFAASEDDKVAASLQDVLNDEYAQASYADAKKKVLAALDKCSRKVKCSSSTKAQANLILGMISAQVGQADDAKDFFKQSISEDPAIKLPERGTSPTIRTIFTEVQKDLAPPPEEVPAIPTPTEPTKIAPGGKVPGWNNPEAFQLAGAAVTADKAGNLQECIDKNKESLKIEEQPRTRLHLASCEQRSGKIIDALKDMQKSLQGAIERKDQPVMQIAQQRVRDLIPKIPKVTFEPPPNVAELKVTFDDRLVPIEALKKKFSVDPGKHTVHAEGISSGVPLVYDEEVNLTEGEVRIVKISLTAPSPGYLTKGQLNCMLQAKSQEEVMKCVSASSKSLLVKTALMTSAYTDTNSVNILSPELTASISSPTSGWNVAGNFLVDLVSAASPDIVSYASPAFKEVRYVAGLGGGFKAGLFNFGLNANYSTEPDYQSRTGGANISVDLNDKLFTPSIAYSHSNDIISRQSSPIDAWSRSFYVHNFEVGVTMVLSPTTVLQLGGSFTTERGDQSKQYRFVPMFDSKTAAKVVPGEPVDTVNRFRQPFRPVEQLPTERDRYAVSARFLQRIKNATLRIEERLYRDSWSQMATTTDARYMMDLGKSFRIWPHLRLHVQTGTNFHRLAYETRVTGTGQIILPTYRTGDRELAPMATGTLGGGTRIELSDSPSLALVGSVDMMFSYFFDSLYVKTRTAFYGTLGVEAEFQ